MAGGGECRNSIGAKIKMNDGGEHVGAAVRNTHCREYIVFYHQIRERRLRTCQNATKSMNLRTLLFLYQNRWAKTVYQFLQL